MDFFKRTLISLASVAVLYYGIEEGRQLYDEHKEADRKFKIVEDSYIREMKKSSPFNQVPITIEIPKINHDNRRRKEWYDRFVSVSINPSDIVFSKGRFLYLSKDKERKNVETISNNAPLFRNYLYSINLDNKKNSDIYLIDKHMNLRKLEYLDEKYVDSGVCVDLHKYFGTIPKNLELGDVNADKKVDIIYEGQISVGDKKRKSINVLIANEDYCFTDKGAVYYLGDKSLKNLLAKDFDSDGDYDLSFTLRGNDKEFFGLENKTNSSINPLNFEDNFRKRARTNSTVHMLILYHPILMHH